jgi:uncharacterized protein
MFSAPGLFLFVGVMPLVETSSYRNRCSLWAGHLQTILPAVFRRVTGLLDPRRERLATPDGDFLDLDWFESGNRRLAILLHGLEGCSRARYMQGMAAALVAEGWDVLAWNFRGCSGDMNRGLRFYHCGETGDLALVLAHGAASYDAVDLVGFSLGGNVILKYLGENPSAVPVKVKAAVVFSVPCDLAASARRLDEPGNRIYTRRFLRSLREKVMHKARLMPGLIDATGVERIRTFGEFDDRYTAPMHGFRNAEDYWTKSSCRQFLRAIQVPTLLVNARNDPFLAEECFPVEEARESDCFFLEVPASGGHVGFFALGGFYWSELRAVEFLRKATGDR